MSRSREYVEAVRNLDSKINANNEISADLLDGQDSEYFTSYDNSTSGLDATSVQAAIDEVVVDKQDALVSGTNIKTVNGLSLPGSGDLVIQGVETGTVIALATTTVPTGYLECNGSAINRTTYASLYAKIGTVFGSGDGSTTFNIPDLRGEFLRGYDHGRGADSGRTFGSYQSWAIQNITGRIRYKHYGMSGAFYAAETTSPVGWYGQVTYQQMGFDASRQVQTSTETRPRNRALMFCIKY